MLVPHNYTGTKLDDDSSNEDEREGRPYKPATLAGDDKPSRSSLHERRGLVPVTLSGLQESK